MKATLCYLIVLIGFLLPGTAFAQRGSDAAHIEVRLSGLQHSLPNFPPALSNSRFRINSFSSSWNECGQTSKLALIDWKRAALAQVAGDD